MLLVLVANVLLANVNAADVMFDGVGSLMLMSQVEGFLEAGTLAPKALKCFSSVVERMSALLTKSLHCASGQGLACHALYDDYCVGCVMGNVQEVVRFVDSSKRR